jgi:tetratricopeptide (TPR) repeat protein
MQVQVRAKILTRNASVLQEDNSFSSASTAVREASDLYRRIADSDDSSQATVDPIRECANAAELAERWALLSAADTAGFPGALHSLPLQAGFTRIARLRGGQRTEGALQRAAEMSAAAEALVVLADSVPVEEGVTNGALSGPGKSQVAGSAAAAAGGPARREELLEWAAALLAQAHDSYAFGGQRDTARAARRRSRLLVGVALSARGEAQRRAGAADAALALYRRAAAVLGEKALSGSAECAAAAAAADTAVRELLAAEAREAQRSAVAAAVRRVEGTGDYVGSLEECAAPFRRAAALFDEAGMADSAEAARRGLREAERADVARQVAAMQAQGGARAGAGVAARAALRRTVTELRAQLHRGWISADECARARRAARRAHTEREEAERAELAAGVAACAAAQRRTGDAHAAGATLLGLAALHRERWGGAGADPGEAAALAAAADAFREAADAAGEGGAHRALAELALRRGRLAEAAAHLRRAEAAAATLGGGWDAEGDVGDLIGRRANSELRANLMLRAGDLLAAAAAIDPDGLLAPPAIPPTASRAGSRPPERAVGKDLGGSGSGPGLLIAARGRDTAQAARALHVRGVVLLRAGRLQEAAADLAAAADALAAQCDEEGAARALRALAEARRRAGGEWRGAMAAAEAAMRRRERDALAGGLCGEADRLAAARAAWRLERLVAARAFPAHRAEARHFALPFLTSAASAPGGGGGGDGGGGAVVGFHGLRSGFRRWRRSAVATLLRRGSKLGEALAAAARPAEAAAALRTVAAAALLFRVDAETCRDAAFRARELLSGGGGGGGGGGGSGGSGSGGSGSGAEGSPAELAASMLLQARAAAADGDAAGMVAALEAALDALEEPPVRPRGDAAEADRLVAAAAARLAEAVTCGDVLWALGFAYMFRGRPPAAAAGGSDGGDAALALGAFRRADALYAAAGSGPECSVCGRAVLRGACYACLGCGARAVCAGCYYGAYERGLGRQWRPCHPSRLFLRASIALGQRGGDD